MDLDRELETVVLIVSAGRGHRIGGEIPKQYMNLGGETILSKTVRIFANHSKVDAVRVVIHPDDQELYNSATCDFSLLTPVFGGAKRQDSVRLGLESLEALNPSNVLIHDSVRPFVSDEIIDNILLVVAEGKCCVPGIAPVDTVKRVENGYVVESLNRSDIWQIQTPQGFLYSEILSAHRSLIGNSLTDDAAVAEAYGLPVTVIPGSAKNIKITHEEDLDYITESLKIVTPDIRAGIGYDVHRFSKGQFVTICGVEIPHVLTLEGHSDADVGLHALTDAILGAAGKGDIGVYFPPSDETWQDAPSRNFLHRAGEIVTEMNGIIQNVDVTIICEAPKITPYRHQMETNISEILSLNPSRVNVKGTTTETLGFTGRKEGIAAQAIATIIINPENSQK